MISSRTWRQSNASRYVRMFQSRRSLLIWKIFGRRLDGWTNADHPTESVPGDSTTLPTGADPNAADLDYTGEIMPPPGSGVSPLSEDEKIMFARWLDLGCPINTDLAKPASAWTPLNLLNAVEEPDQARRLEVELPSGVQGNLFLRVQKP